MRKPPPRDLLLSALGKEPFILDRSSSYIGTLIDDLITKGANEPYRMMTSRSEYRLILRQDNADARLTPLGYNIGLISQERYEKFLKKQAEIKEEIERIENTTLPPSEELNRILVSRETSPVTTGVKIADLLRRPQITYEDLKELDANRPERHRSVFEEAEIEVKYAGYIKKQLDRVEQVNRMREKALPTDIDYREITGLRLEAQEKLNKIKPINIAQASRISGVSPADISVLVIWLSK